MAALFTGLGLRNRRTYSCRLSLDYERLFADYRLVTAPLKPF